MSSASDADAAPVPSSAAPPRAPHPLLADLNAASLSALRKVPDDEKHHTPAFSALMSEVMAFPRAPTDAGAPPPAIPPALHIAPVSATRDVDGLRAHSCSHVLSCLLPSQYPYVAAPEDPTDATDLTVVYQWPGVVYKRVHVNDVEDADIAALFDEAHAFIDDGLTAGTGVLVHCRAGVSRSATIVVSYLMRRFGWARDKALATLREQHSAARPNPGFMAQLAAFERALNEKK